MVLTITEVKEHNIIKVEADARTMPRSYKRECVGKTNAQTSIIYWDGLASTAEAEEEANHATNS